MSELILGINTVSTELEVCLISADELVSNFVWEKNNNESDKILSNIQKLFEMTKFKLSEIDLIAVTVGPGSYTGTRIGVSVANGLAYSLNKELMPVQTELVESKKLSDYLLGADLSKVERFSNIEPVYAKEATITVKKF